MLRMTKRFNLTNGTYGMEDFIRYQVISEIIENNL